MAHLNRPADMNADQAWDLLAAYMKHLWTVEGSNFLGGMSSLGTPLTTEQFQLLQDLSDTITVA